MKHLVLVFLLMLASESYAAYSGYVETDKIHLLVYGDDKEAHEEEILGYNPHVQVVIKIDLENVTQVEFNDVSDLATCYDRAPFSPSTIATYTLDPKVKIKNIVVRFQYPCAAYRQAFYYAVKVKTLQGNYFIRKKFPVKLLNRLGGDGS
jgi:hypothetical protein